MSLEEFFVERDDLSEGRKGLYRAIFKRLANFSSDPFNMSKDEVNIVKAKLGEVLGDGTWNTYMACLKRFYKWKNGDEEYPDNVAHIKLKKLESDELRAAQQILSEGEFLALLRSADHPRDRALLCVLDVCGFRRGAIVKMRIRDIDIQPHGYDILGLSGKTPTFEPPSLLGTHAKVFRVWLEHHPQRDNPDAFVFVKIHGKRYEPICSKYVNQLVREIATRAGVRIGDDGKSRVSSKWFRHTAATNAAKDGLTEATLRRLFGWSRTSKQPTIYVNLARGDARQLYLKAKGVLKREIEKSQLEPIKCLYCGQENPPMNKFCHYCGTALDEEEAKKIVAENRFPFTEEDRDLLWTLLQKLRKGEITL